MDSHTASAPKRLCAHLNGGTTFTILYRIHDKIPFTASPERNAKSITKAR